MKRLIQRYFDNTSNSKIQKYRQYLALFSVLILVAISCYVFNYFIHLETQHQDLPKEEEKIKVELGTYGVKGDKLWQQDFDERLIKEQQDRDNQYGKLNKIIEELETKLENEKERLLSKEQEEILMLKEQISWLKEELQHMHSTTKDEVLPENSNITSTKIADTEVQEELKDMNNYIPAGSFISGILRGGVSVSTGTGAPAEPTPIFIMVTGYGDLPQNFNADLTNCRLIGSSYGNLANERIIARVETLSCSDPLTNLVTETDVVGVVHSTDSKNGIKGHVISMSEKHLKNAFMGGMLSGFAATSKQGQTFLFNPSLGTLAETKPSFKEKLGENSLTGLGNAAEKIADYHLKMAEATAPVIEVPGGARVTIFFSKGVFLGSRNVKDEIKRERK